MLRVLIYIKCCLESQVESCRLNPIKRTCIFFIGLFSQSGSTVLIGAILSMRTSWLTVFHCSLINVFRQNSKFLYENQIIFWRMCQLPFVSTIFCYQQSAINYKFVFYPSSVIYLKNSIIVVSFNSDQWLIQNISAFSTLVWQERRESDRERERKNVKLKKNRPIPITSTTFTLILTNQNNERISAYPLLPKFANRTLPSTIKERKNTINPSPPKQAKNVKTNEIQRAHWRVKYEISDEEFDINETNRIGMYK